ncbi:DUF397 domain-containing protein [Streptomyces sp. SB3404]|uniref:DUF397 domain-containing protein n=1 Tax=Streptomyces boncukensis TaxID=2711219 RepID=A0A6G4X7I2_9ACTN|nr:DUF397 domain-containing protein [Streptomyces boncukensis]
MPWLKSSHSGGNDNCVEVAVDGHVVALRDSKDTARPYAKVSRAAWRHFLFSVAGGAVR